LKEETLICGRHAVLEALRAGGRRIIRIHMLRGGGGGIMREIASCARSRGIEVAVAERAELQALAGHVPHRGVVAVVSGGPAAGETSVDDLLDRARAAGDPAFIVALDELKDPQNVGAILRTAEGAGAHGVVMTANRSASLGAGVERASAGAVEYVPVARVVNMRSALVRLKESGCWVVGADASATKEYTRADLTGPVVLVLGEEGRGLRDLTRRCCDDLVRIPMRGKVESLNVSASAAVLCYELVRQRGEKTAGRQ
jgi:23S rRNA (guanosine2251-2'-O)-methyltransferase